MISLFRAVGWTLLWLFLSAAFSFANATALPPGVSAYLDQAARIGQAQIEQQKALSRSLGNSVLAARYVEQARENVGSSIAAAVVVALERRPDLANSIVGHAFAIAPQARSRIAGAVRSAFPGLAARTPLLSRGRPAPASPAAATQRPDLRWYDQPAPRRYAQPIPSPHPAAPAVAPRAAPISEYNFAIPADMQAVYVRAGYIPPGQTRPGTAPGIPTVTPPAQGRLAYDYAAYDSPVAAVAPETPGEKALPLGEAQPDVMYDPLEPFNRAMFAVNDLLDILIIRPVAKIYSFTPEPIRLSVRKAYDNLGEPLVFVNDLLQLDFNDAGAAAGRFLINSTVGVAGLFDPATSLGLEAHTADFGQTLHSYGIGSGPYLVLPLIGPSTLRDTVGLAGDVLLNPVNYALTDEMNIRLGLVVGEGLVRREEYLEPLDELRRSSVDYYAAVRGAHYQSRAVDLAKGRADAAITAIDKLFDELE